MDWTRAETLICPDCGYAFGSKTAAGTLNMTFDPKSLRRQCRRVTDDTSGEIHCPRFDEAKRAADRSDRTGPALEDH